MSNYFIILIYIINIMKKILYNNIIIDNNENLNNNDKLDYNNKSDYNNRLKNINNNLKLNNDFLLSNKDFNDIIKTKNTTFYDNTNQDTYISYNDIKLYDLFKNDLPKYNHFDLLKSFILIIDFPMGGGGTSVFLKSILLKYKNYQTFLIIRKFNNNIIITINDDYILNKFNETECVSFLKENIDKINKIFINHILNHTTTFINKIFKLNKEITTITHDFLLIMEKPQYFFNNMSMQNKKDLNSLNINNCDMIITQNKYNLVYYNKFINNNKKIVVSDLPDFRFSDKLIINNLDKIIIGIIGNISEIKGYSILVLLINYYSSYKNIEFVIFGDLNKKFNIVVSERYNTIYEFNELLKKYKPNVLLELSLCPETYCYALTLGMLTRLPIISIMKNNLCVVEDRLKKYDKVYYFSTIHDFDYLINKYKQDYFYTIKPVLYFNSFWDDYFINKNKIINNNKFLYDIKPYCIYFPQFYNIPENNINFYDGYTDIHNLNVLKTNNIIDNLETPSLDYFNINHITEYNLTNKNIIKKQIDLLVEYNLSGFAVYYYWFSKNTITNKNMIMDDVINIFFHDDINLKDKKVFFIWANENWSDNVNFCNKNKHIIENIYETKYIRKNINNLMKYFLNDKYLKIDNKPVFFIHHSCTIKEDELDNIYNIFNEECKKNNFDGIHIIINSINDSHQKYKKYVCNLNYKYFMLTNINNQKCIDYKKYIDNYLLQNNQNKNIIDTLVFNFDNRSRFVKPNKLDKSLLCIENTELNKILFVNTHIKKYENRTNEIDKILLINAWNEWGEKMTLEPSNEMGFYYLNLLITYLTNFSINSNNNKSQELEKSQDSLESSELEKSQESIESLELSESEKSQGLEIQKLKEITESNNINLINNNIKIINKIINNNINQILLDQLYKINIFIFCSGQSGGSTLAKTLDNNLYNIIHLHTSICVGIYSLNKYNLNNINIFDIINHNKEKNNIYIIDSYRNPIERKISSFFQYLKGYIQNYNELSIQELIDFFNNNLLETIEEYHSINEVFEHYKINKFDKFNFDKKYNYMKHENMILIKLRFKDIKEWNKILTKIFGKQTEIYSDNLTENKEYYNLYKEFLQEYKLPKKYINILKNNTEFKIYNTPKEQMEYIKYWENKCFDNVKI